MSMRSENHHRPRSRNRYTNSLAFEQLEARAMFAMDAIESEIQSLLAPDGWQLQATANPTVGSAPSVASAVSIIGGSNVVARTAQFSVLGSDNDGESSLRYRWQAVSAPAGGTITFAKNNANAAKLNTLTFNKPGTYAVRVTIEDRNGLKTTSNLQFSVVQTLASIAVTTADGRNIPSQSSINQSESSQRFTVTGLDQFGKPMATQPAVVWQTLSKPSASTINIASSGTAVTATYNSAGVYSLQAKSGAVSIRFAMNVTQTLASINIATANGMPIDAATPVAVSGTSSRITVRGTDQFGNPMTTLPGMNWSAARKPSAASATVSLAGGTAVVTFNRAGDYLLKAQSGTKVAFVAFNVPQELASIAALGVNNQPMNVSSPIAIPGMNVRISGVALDQFGSALSQQPTIAWRVTSQPSVAEVALSPTGNSVTAVFDRAGSYSLTAQSGEKKLTVVVSAAQTLSSIRVATPGGDAVESGIAIAVSGSAQKLHVVGVDQFGGAMSALTGITWTTQSSPAGGSASVTFASGIANVTVTRAGNYVIRAAFGKIVQTFTLAVAQQLTSIVTLTPSNQIMSAGAKLTVSGTTGRVAARALDQFGQTMKTQPVFDWSPLSAPAGGEATIHASGSQATMAFDQAGQYSFRIAAGNRSATMAFSVTQSLMQIRVTASVTRLEVGERHQFRAVGIDQFQHPITLPSSTPFAWSASHGTITTGGLYTAGSQAGSGTVTVRLRSFTSSTGFSIVAPAPVTSLQNPAIQTLIESLFIDQQLSRLDMIAILRSAGIDDVVDASELADFRYLVSADSPYAIPSYVRELAKDVVNNHPANLKFKGQLAGNLVAGSPAILLNQLVDKWFYGADEPILMGAGLSYQTALGSLFTAAPSRDDALQGVLGDCYFIASLASIADKNPDAVRNLFIDNGDDTYTVRFYGGALGAFYTSSGSISSGFASGSGTADYVTVNLRLPAYSDGALSYSGYGLSVFSPTTPLWIALAEKAYAQWNETGNSGRDGTNRYAAIEGGWMSNVNAQVLGYNSTSYVVGASTKQAMISAIGADRSITIGTLPTASSGGLVGSHAYIVTGYDLATDKFKLHNPWGVAHPIPLTWAQLQSNTTQFVVADPTGSTTFHSGLVSSGAELAWIGSWTPPANDAASSSAMGMTAIDDTNPTHQVSLDALWEAIGSETHQGIVSQSIGKTTMNHHSIATASDSERSTDPLAARWVDLVIANCGHGAALSRT